MNTGHAVHLLYGCVVVGMWYTVAVVHLNMCTLNVGHVPAMLGTVIMQLGLYLWCNSISTFCIRGNAIYVSYTMPQHCTYRVYMLTTCVQAVHCTRRVYMLTTCVQAVHCTRRVCVHVDDVCTGSALYTPCVCTC